MDIVDADVVSSDNINTLLPDSELRLTIMSSIAQDEVRKISERVKFVPPIVSEEIWDKANQILQKRSKEMSSGIRTSYNNKYTYSGKIVCTGHGCHYQRGLYRYPSGNKEVWQCKRYIEKGKDGCTMPILYTTELNQIMKECYDEIITNKADIIHDLVKTYSSISEKSTIKQDMAKHRVEIENISRRKDKLLDLSIDGKLSDDEFETRNNAFNNEIAGLKMKIEDLEAQERTNAETRESIEALRKVIAKQLDFSGGFDHGIIDSLLDKIEVYPTEKKNEIDIKVRIKVVEESLDYHISRGRKNTSVCTRSYMLQVTKRNIIFERRKSSRGSGFAVACNVELYIAIGLRL